MDIGFQVCYLAVILNVVKNPAFTPSPAGGRGLGRGASEGKTSNGGTGTKSGLPDSKLLSFACSKESNQRKEHPTMAYGFPALLKKSGSCGTRVFNPQTVLAEIPRLFCAVPARGMSAKCPLFHSDLGAIGMAAGE
jgi:hypothetical protein